MTKINNWILASCFLCFICSGSIVEKIDIDSYETCSRLQDSTRDSEGNIHFLYSLKPDMNLKYIKIDPQGKLLANYTLFDKNLETANIKHADGNLYVAFCSEKKIYFTEAHVKFNNWTKPILLHDDSNKFGRDNPQVMFVKETGRLFVFYIKGDTIVMDRTHVACVSRPQGSTLFTTENIIDKLEHIDTFAIAWTPSFWSKSSIHVYATIFGNDGENRTIWQTISDSNGINWGKPKPIATQVEYAISPRIVMDADSPSNLYLSYAKYKPKNLAVKYSTDKGDSWSKEYISEAKIGLRHPHDINTNNLELVKIGKKSTLVSLLETGDLDQYFYAFWDIPAMTEKPQTHPFNGIYSRGALLSAYSFKEKMHIAFFIANDTGPCTGGHIVMGLDGSNQLMEY